MSNVIKIVSGSITQNVNNGIVSFTKRYDVHFDNGLFTEVPFMVYDLNTPIYEHEIIDIAMGDWRATASKEFADSCQWK